MQRLAWLRLELADSWLTSLRGLIPVAAVRPGWLICCGRATQDPTSSWLLNLGS
jgi:hypothetical protein